MPGYGFSGRPATTGWDEAHIARAWVVLMKRLGYTQFVAQGGDWGAIITDLMGVHATPELLGIHVNMPGVFPLDIDGALASGGPVPSGLPDDVDWALITDAFADNLFPVINLYSQSQTWAIVTAVPVLSLVYLLGLLCIGAGEALLIALRLVSSSCLGVGSATTGVDAQGCADGDRSGDTMGRA
jgi:pimeloyl-ACP methyl ester carboxylesterase